MKSKVIHLKSLGPDVPGMKEQCFGGENTLFS